MRAPTLLAVLFASLSALLISACQEEALSGIYSTTFESGVLYGAQGMETCEPPYKQLGDDGPCYEPYEATNTLGLLERDNGDLRFAASLWFFNAHSCTIDGVAKKDEDGWLYTSSYEYDMGCALRITKDGSGISFSVAEDAACRSYCGMRGSLDNVNFPLSSKEETQVSEADISCITSGGDSCKKQAEATE